MPSVYTLCLQKCTTILQRFFHAAADRPVRDLKLPRLPVRDLKLPRLPVRDLKLARSPVRGLKQLLRACL